MSSRSSLGLRADADCPASKQRGKAISAGWDHAERQQGEGKHYEEFAGLKNLMLFIMLRVLFQFAVYFKSYKHETWRSKEILKVPE